MRLSDHINENLIFIIDEPSDKLSFLRTLADLIESQFPSIDGDELFLSLKDREADVTTGIGNGIAIPHTLISGLKEPVCIIVKTPLGIDFNALDKLPVYLLLVLLSPKNSTRSHLNLLAEVATLVMNNDFIERIIETNDKKEIKRLIAEGGYRCG